MSDRPCKLCDKPLLFVPHADSGKTLPLERVQSVYLIVDGKATRQKAGPLYVSHFETCPHAAAFSRNRAKR